MNKNKNFKEEKYIVKESNIIYDWNMITITVTKKFICCDCGFISAHEKDFATVTYDNEFTCEKYNWGICHKCREKEELDWGKYESGE